MPKTQAFPVGISFPLVEDVFLILKVVYACSVSNSAPYTSYISYSGCAEAATTQVIYISGHDIGWKLKSKLWKTKTFWKRTTTQRVIVSFLEFYKNHLRGLGLPFEWVFC